MPWTGKTFAEKHAKALKGKAADKAAEIANAMVAQGSDESVAIATAIKRAKAMSRRETLYDHPRSRHD